MPQPDHHRPEAPSDQTRKAAPKALRALHELYYHWTAQTPSLRFDRERLRYEFLRPTKEFGALPHCQQIRGFRLVRVPVARMHQG